MSKPIIGITMGDPNSIGPEIAVKALLNPAIHAICRPLLVGEARVFLNLLHKLKLPVSYVNAVKNVQHARFEQGRIDVFDLLYADIDKLWYGEISAMAGAASFWAVKQV